MPAWLALGVEVRLTAASGGTGAGTRPERDHAVRGRLPRSDAEQLIESYSRHFLTWLDTWNNEGFAPIHNAWDQRADKRERSFTDAGGGGARAGVRRAG